MNWANVTRWFTALAAFAIITYDVIAVLSGGDQATISHQILIMSYKQPAIPLFGGGLVAHFFWNGEPITSRPLCVTLAGSILAVTAILSALAEVTMTPLYPFAVGVVLGRALVPQSKPSNVLKSG